jgi:maltose alpha-D-glucosyltransferase / alpha-amylase
MTNYSWFKNAVFYSLDVETFYDSNGDGIGDFDGLISKLDFVAGLGVNCIWLLPFYPSPNHDNGYDVMDYFNIDERLGTMGDFSMFMEKAGQLGIHVIIDLVVNHTSIKHPWFQQARKDKKSPYRDFYVWSDKPLEFENEQLILEGEEHTMWTYDKVAKQYYLHRFYKQQPDLNIANPRVRNEILKIMAFWLRLGVSGFRIDATELLVENYGLNRDEDTQLEDFLDEMYEFAVARDPNVLLLAEVNAGPAKMRKFISGGRRIHMLFNFYINQYLMLSLAKKDSSPLSKALASLPKLHQHNQWLNFLRHHDELNLKQLSTKDQQIVFDKFAPEAKMRIYRHGIRRRIAPMMEEDPRMLRLAYSLLFSLPGIPLIRYGDEIGMGDDLALEGRNSVRTPMQWSDIKNGGFSSASASNLVHPVIRGGLYGFQKVNVLKSHHDSSSLLNWVERLITTRKQCPEVGMGTLKIVPFNDNRVLIHGYEMDEHRVYFIHNFSGDDIKIERDVIAKDVKNIFDVLGEGNGEEEPGIMHIKPFVYRWLRILK